MCDSGVKAAYFFAYVLKNAGKYAIIALIRNEGDLIMNELIQQFIIDEVTDLTYKDLWNFVKSNSICRGTYEGRNHIVMKISSNQFIIYRVCIGMENTKYQVAVLIAKNYLLKKINSRAYQLQLEDIQNILD